MNSLVTATAFLDIKKTVKHLKRMEHLWLEKIYHRTEKRNLPVDPQRDAID
jgi:tRNA (Thr-GGU) A37 N-methylase